MVFRAVGRAEGFAGEINSSEALSHCPDMNSWRWDLKCREERQKAPTQRYSAWRGNKLERNSVYIGVRPLLDLQVPKDARTLVEEFIAVHEYDVSPLARV